jgi:Spy/CpxP family protein refolding chaperone
VNVWKVILVTLVIFSTGAITGGLVARKTASHPPQSSWQNSSTNRPQQAFKPDRMYRRHFLRKAQEELGLTPEQTEEIEAIVSASQVRTRELWEEISPQMRAEFQATQEEIRAVLTPEQQELYERMMDRRRPSRRGDGERRPPPPEPDPGHRPPPPTEQPPEA